MNLNNSTFYGYHFMIFLLKIGNFFENFFLEKVLIFNNQGKIIIL
jgi:hypothetical protein